ncbi:MAG TPA: hypothetical protein VFQ22_05125, partial [Longimicrobiales bacterium]|nr:hypothetical protein [Longimicrobiales bacterium]
EYEGHDLFHLRATYQVTERMEIFGRVSNLLDERYAESARYTPFRGQELAPGQPRTFYVGVRVR